MAQRARLGCPGWRGRGQPLAAAAHRRRSWPPRRRPAGRRRGHREGHEAAAPEVRGAAAPGAVERHLHGHEDAGGSPHDQHQREQLAARAPSGAASPPPGPWPRPRTGSARPAPAAARLATRRAGRPAATATTTSSSGKRQSRKLKAMAFVATDRLAGQQRAARVPQAGGAQLGRGGGRRAAPPPGRRARRGRRAPGRPATPPASPQRVARPDGRASDEDARAPTDSPRRGTAAPRPGGVRRSTNTRPPVGGVEQDDGEDDVGVELLVGAGEGQQHRPERPAPRGRRPASVARWICARARKKTPSWAMGR